MSRESCILHSPKQATAIVRQDYYELMDRDACAAALLNIFEYWANAAITADAATDAATEQPWVGARPIREFEQMLLGIATDKQIRKRLAQLEAKGFIRTQTPAKRGEAKAYQVLVSKIQHALVAQATKQETTPRSNNRYPLGQMTDNDHSLRSNNRQSFGQMTSDPSVKQPMHLRSFDRALKNKSKEFKKEDLKEAPFSSMKVQPSALKTTDRTTDFKQARNKPARNKPVRNKPARDKQVTQQANLEQAERRLPTQVGLVRYAQPPENIDLADLWASNPGMAKVQARFIAPGHKRLEMVAHGFGQWWIGPGLNDFDEFLIKACQQRKRKLEQPDSIADAKTFINNLLRKGDWANFSLRCDEAKVLRDHAFSAQTHRAKETARTTTTTPFSTHDIAHAQRSHIQAEQRRTAIGLAKFKVSQGEIARAKEIADLLGLVYSDIGLIAHAAEPIAS